MVSAVRAKSGQVAFVLLGHGFDSRNYRAAFERGEVPDETPYGFHLAEELGWTLIFSVDRAEGRVGRFVRRTLRRLLGFDLVHAWANRDGLREANIVWTMTENEWLAARCLGILSPSSRRPIIGNSVWLFNEWESRGALRRWLIRRLSHGEGVLTVHSDRYLPIARAVLPAVPVQRMFFGVMVEPQDQCPPTIRIRESLAPLRILAMGNDWTRDWDTFLAAYGNDPRFEINLVCGWVGQDRRSQYTNLVPRRPTAALSRTEMRALYAWSDLVVVPMVENRFSGITSAIDACGRGKPLISTRTGGVPTYFEDCEVIYVEPGDVSAMREAAFLLDDQLLTFARNGQTRFLRDDYSSQGMVARYAALSAKVLENV